ncbi:unnamed protein product [Periconia digitata]|uniref:Polyketide synthase n=1 Tax=Periconia digitata TaxID=1303443 RepID=A0A9W4XWN0_9PLEO|nr:unnamed protein product [Periconia digitata]
MAPYALTPTSERGSQLNSLDTTIPSTTNATHHINGTNGHASDLSSGSTPTSAASHEAAYIHGYKEGYTKSHIELKHQPIAIIGMSCRFPGNVSTPDEFWELLARSRTGFSEIPSSRFSGKRFFHPNPGKSGTTNAKGGNFLTQPLEVFDAPFFGFTQQEAISLDPQQRLLLECTFEALESAGIPKQHAVGKDVGVFVGGTFSDYDADLFRDAETIPMHQATGCHMAMQANRVSHFFDFRGPSFTLDTACSSSLVALHNACQSLRLGESTMAVAAGVHLNMLPEFWISMSMSRLFGEAGRSFAFDQRGTGYGRGEGCGMVLLKPMEQAIKDNDPIRAIITGSGINQDGKTPGITMPNGSAQESLIRSVYKLGGMDPRETGYVEAHGTGTRVGDPIEVSALHSVFGEGRNKRKPLFVGSVKSNIGHLEAAAGIAGVIKTALMLERGFILPNYDFKVPNEKLPLDEWGFKVATRQTPWPFGKKWASINGFGFGGTNSHVVMTRGPLERKTMSEEIDTTTTDKLFLLSANDKASAERTMQSLGVYLEQRPEVFQNDLLGNLAYTLGQRKTIHPWRLAITASTSAELVEAMSSGKIFPAKQDLEPLRFGWIFTGQGAQWWAMGRELYLQYPIYASALEKADAHLRSIGAEFSLLEELQKDEATTLVNAAHISQPACTAVQLALVQLLKSWDLQPTSVAGHSSGEIGAAFAAGIITFEDAMTIAYHRGRLIPILKKRYPNLDGSMLAVGAGPVEITPLLDQIDPTLGEARIACINSPSSVTISGDTAAISDLQSIIKRVNPDMFARKLQVDTAYHSHHMNLVAKDYTESLLQLDVPKSTEVQFHSSLMGRLATSNELDASYWVQNLTCAVRFDDAVQSMCEITVDNKADVNFLIELGPHAALQGPIKQILKSIGGSAVKMGYSSVLGRKKNAVQTALALAGTLFVKGANLNMGAINFPKPRDRLPQVLTDMPRYPWNHTSKFWHESRLTQIHKHHDVLRNDIIGVLATYSSDLEPTWRNIVRLDDLPWLRHHQMQGVTIFPISGFAAMALEAKAQILEAKNTKYDALQIENLHVPHPIMLTEEELEMTITLCENHEKLLPHSSHDFRIRSWSKSQGWMEHCTGIVSYLNEVDGQRSEKLRKSAFAARLVNIDRAATQAVNISQLYDQLSSIGVSYGPSFQGMRDAQASPQASLAKIVRVDTTADMPHHYETNYILHPTLLESLISLYWPVVSKDGELDTVHLPSSIGKITVSAKLLQVSAEPGSSLQAHCQPSSTISHVSSNTLSMFATSSLDSTEPLISVEDLIISPILEKAVDTEELSARELCYKTEWEPAFQASDDSIGDKNAPQFDTDVVVVHGESESQTSLAATISEQLLHLTGRQPTTGTLTSIADSAKEKHCIFLNELDSPVLANLDQSEFQALQSLITSTQGLLWVVRGAYMNANNPDANMVSGLSRTIRSEGTLMKFVTLDLDVNDSGDGVSDATNILQTFTESFHNGSEVEETEFTVRDGKFLTPRIVNDDTMNEYVNKHIHPPASEPSLFTSATRPLCGTLNVPGVPESVVFKDDQSGESPLPADHVAFQVKAIGLDATNGHTHSRVGLQSSGIVQSVGANVSNVKVGDHVAALMPQGSLSTVARAHSKFLFKLPGHITFDAAATIPEAYCTASYALIEKARLVEGERLLIHDAATAVGQAALGLAQMIGADIWVTVKTASEKDLLKSERGIDDGQIWYAKSESFADGIMSDTDGNGVDVIFNTTSDSQLMRATGRCLAAFGRFINVGAQPLALGDILSNQNVTALSVDLNSLIQHRPRHLERLIADLQQLLRYGKVRPAFNFKTYGVAETAAAIHAAHTSVGHSQIVIVPRDDETVLAPRIEQQRLLLRSDATYVLIGGTGGLGRSMAKWMLGKGAKHIVLLSRSGEVKGKAKDQIDDMNASGASIVVRRCNVADKGDVEHLLSTGVEGLPPVRGVIHGAMVLHDVLFEKMTFAQYHSVIESKVQGAKNFHQTLLANSTPLDFFICISSAAGAVGNRGQAAYAAANTFLNGFVQQLRSQGISATSIDLTAVSDTGYLAEDAEKAAEVARNLGGDTICEAEVLSLIQASIERNVDTCGGHPITGMRITATQRPFWSNDAKFKHLLRVAEAASASSFSAAVKVSWGAAFKASASRADGETVVCSALVEKIAEVISMEQEELDVTRPLAHYPLDSLTAIEVRNFITRIFEANLQVLELLASGSIESLAKIVCGKSKGKTWEE